MATEIVMPKIGFSMTEAVLTEWVVENGASVKEGDPLFAFESDKSTQEVDAPATGTLRIKKPIGETYIVGTILAVIE